MPDIDLTELSLEQKAELLTGGSFWSTAALPEHGVREIVLTDGPHGVRRQIHGTDHLGIYHSEPATCFPPAVAIGSSWSEAVAAAAGTALARESIALGVDVLLGPGVNIKRSPLGGRNFEYLSEDPLLSGILASAYVNALQAGGVGASLKHFAANDQETERMVVSSDVDERSLREIHLSAFERVVSDANPATVMCSYNRINGVYASENEWLLTDVLRGEWGFEGLVVSDWGAVRDRSVSLAAGLDLAMPGTGDQSAASIVAAVRAGHLSEEVVDVAARRVLGLQSITTVPDATFDADAHHVLARELAAECAVLLRNEAGTLPLRPGSNVLVIGEFAIEPRFQGGGSSHVNATIADRPFDCLRARVETLGGRASFSQGYASGSQAVQDASAGDAVEMAAHCDVAVVFAGLLESAESEGFDRQHLRLPDEQVSVIHAVAAVAKRTVVVLANGGIVTVEEWHDEVDAILEGFLLGQGGGDAIASILAGEISPSGHLAETVPRRLQDVSSYLTFPGEQGHVRYGEGVMVGYRHFETAEVSARYPFGHGLGYTTFETSALTVEATGGDTARARVTVSNTGSVAGKHVVQLYVSSEAGPIRRPKRELRAFTKVHLEPGEHRTVELDLDRRSFAYWDVQRHRWIVAGGDYAIQVCESAAVVIDERTITLEGDDEVPVISLQSTLGEWLGHPVAGPQLRERITPIIAASGQDVTEGSDMMTMITSMPMMQLLGLMGGAIDSDWLLTLTGSDA